MKIVTVAAHLDHITITAPSLEAGSEFVREVLGVAPQEGGEHPRMGTHNRLLHLGESMFLEVIAINPAAIAPTRPRWFGLDTLPRQALPALSTWVARTADIRNAVMASPEGLGSIEPMSRGTLDWLITIPEDGSLPLGGLAPALIEWSSAAHPATKLIDRNLRLMKLELFSPHPERLEHLLRALGVDAPVSIRPAPVARLVAHIATPQGIRLLSSPGTPGNALPYPHIPSPS